MDLLFRLVFGENPLKYSFQYFLFLCLLVFVGLDVLLIFKDFVFRESLYIIASVGLSVAFFEFKICPFIVVFCFSCDCLYALLYLYSFEWFGVLGGFMLGLFDLWDLEL